MNKIELLSTIGLGLLWVVKKFLKVNIYIFREIISILCSCNEIISGLIMIIVGFLKLLAFVYILLVLFDKTGSQHIEFDILVVIVTLVIAYFGRKIAGVIYIINDELYDRLSSIMKKL